MEKFKVYYGEYPLSHWLKLILKKDIELPPYQRNFVWSEEKVLKLLESFDKGLFIPPVTIGTYSDEEEKKHFILDGQQRLSAVLLAYLGKFPDKSFEQGNIIQMASDTDGELESDEDDGIDIKNWKLSYIQEIAVSHKNYHTISSSLLAPKYKEFNSSRYNINNDFLEKHSLGFSYIKPLKTVTQTEQKRYYSSIFRNINITGMKLTPEESRSSLYWLNSSLEQFFKPQLLDKVTIDKNKIDFARYLAFTAEYFCHYTLREEIKEFRIAIGYGSRAKPYEEYIEKFVYHCVEESTSSLFLPFKDMFSDSNDIEPRIQRIYDAIIHMKENTTFSSIIAADYFLFGLIFWILFMNKELNYANNLSTITTEINRKLEHIKTQTSYARQPSSVGRIRERMYFSINLYRNHMI